MITELIFALAALSGLSGSVPTDSTSLTKQDSRVGNPVFLPHGKIDRSTNETCMASAQSLINEQSVNNQFYRVGVTLYRNDKKEVNKLRRQLEKEGKQLHFKEILAKKLKTKPRYHSEHDDWGASPSRYKPSQFYKRLERLTNDENCRSIGVFLPPEVIEKNDWLTSWYCGDAINQKSLRDSCDVSDFILRQSKKKEGKTKIVIANSEWYFNINEPKGSCPYYEDLGLNKLMRGGGFWHQQQSCTGDPKAYKDAGILLHCINTEDNSEYLEWIRLDKLVLTSAVCRPVW